MAPHIRTKKSNKRKERETRGVENWIMDNDSVTVSLALHKALTFERPVPHPPGNLGSISY